MNTEPSRPTDQPEEQSGVFKRKPTGQNANQLMPSIARLKERRIVLEKEGEGRLKKLHEERAEILQTLSEDPQKRVTSLEQDIKEIDALSAHRPAGISNEEWRTFLVSAGTLREAQVRQLAMFRNGVKEEGRKRMEATLERLEQEYSKLTQHASEPYRPVEKVQKETPIAEARGKEVRLMEFEKLAQVMNETVLPELENQVGMFGFLFKPKKGIMDSYFRADFAPREQAAMRTRYDKLMTEFFPAERLAFTDAMQKIGGWHRAGIGDKDVFPSVLETFREYFKVRDLKKIKREIKRVLHPKGEL